MDRRAAMATIAGGALTLAGGAGATRLPAKPILDRLGMTTVCLRDRIPTDPNQAIPLVSPPLALLDAPRFIRATFGLTNVEVWNFQFPSDSDDFCTSLRTRAAKAGCRISNLQLDGDYDLSSPDANVRQRSIAFIKGWMLRTSLLGAPTMRANLDNGSPKVAFDPAPLVPIIRELADYGRTIGIKLLIENHIGNSRPITNVARLLSLVKHEYVGGLLDWGNSDAANLEQRLADFALLFPYLALVSAKGLHFDPQGQHVEYPIRPIVLATEKSGYRGLYSIELYADDNFPDPVVAVKSMMASISNAIADAETIKKNSL